MRERMSFEDLKDIRKRKQIPPVPGFYKVYLPKDMEVKFSKTSRANDKCYKVNEQKDIKYLKTIWDQLKEAHALDERILYIGKGIDINKRLNLYKRVMFNNGTNHSGGVFICQIANCERLEIEWIEYKSSAVIDFLHLPPKEKKNRYNPIRRKVEEELDKEETRLIEEYKMNHEGLRPFANRNK